MMHLERLPWDSKFFGYEIGRTKLQKETIDPGQIREEMLKVGFDLVYLFSDIPQQKIEARGSVLVDRKITFEKCIENKNSVTHVSGIEPYKPTMNSRQLDKLAVQSGIYSRFRKDEILTSKFEEFYKTWMKKSLNKELADEVLVYIGKTAEAGMVTLSKTDASNGMIGLIAVDESQRGKGIGTALIQAAESWCVENDIEKLGVVTQGDNEEACNFYQKSGFKIANEVFVYHIWATKIGV